MPYFVSDDIIEKFRDKDLLDAFPKAEVVNNDLGSFLRIKDPFEGLEEKYRIKPDELSIFRRFTEQKLSLVNGINEKTSQIFRKKKLNHISELIGLGYTQFHNAETLNTSISCSDYETMLENSNVRTGDLLFCVEPEELLFLDIETTGQTSSELFLIGIGYFEKIENGSYEFNTELLFARELVDEVSILKYFVDLLPRYRMFVTYNGRMFDIPFIRNRICTLLETEDIQETYAKFNEENSNDLFLVDDIIDHIIDKFLHFDLYFEIRYTYKDLLPNYRLVTAEEHILDFYRDEYLPSGNIPMIYIDWVAEPEKYTGAIFKVIQHNYYDIINLARLMKEWISTNILMTYNKTIRNTDEPLEKVKTKLNDDEKNEIIVELEQYYSSLKRTNAKTLDDFL